jgi:photosystem II CP47 chlorophyll apoprotein
MLLYELIVIDLNDPAFNPQWCQFCYILPLFVRIGVINSLSVWGLGFSLNLFWWGYEIVVTSHVGLSGLLILSSFWHWANWDLDLFICSTTGRLSLDLFSIFGIHLLLSSLACFGFGYVHLTGLYGPGMWTSDALGLLGSVRYVKPFFSVVGLTRWCFGVIPAHHIIAGFFGILLSLWHISARPGGLLYRALRCSNFWKVS